MNAKIFFDRVSKRHHEVAVDNLAQSLRVSREGVNTLYTMVLRHYTKNAKIKYFLSALVTKRVKEVLRDEKPPTNIEGRRNSREL